jgi:hypothetical protein
VSKRHPEVLAERLPVCETASPEYWAVELMDLLMGQMGVHLTRAALLLPLPVGREED